MNKKILTAIVFIIILIGGMSVFAEVVTTRKLNPLNRPTGSEKQSTNKLVENIKTCKPYTENLNTNVGGMDFNFNVKINGWIDNKCRMDFAAKSTGINSLFKSIYGVDSSEAMITTFEPKVRCDFTKSQLESVGDSILQEEERNNGAKNNMLKNPADIDISSFIAPSENDSKLLNLVLNDRACKILNVDDSNGVFDSFFGY